MTYASLFVTQVLNDLHLGEVFFPNETAEERDEHSKLIIRYLAFAKGRKDSQSWVGEMDGEKDDTAILGDLVIAHTLYQPLDGLDRSLYHDIYTQMALIEGATGLDLSSAKQLKRAVASYWLGVRKTIQQYKLQYEQRKSIPSWQPKPSIQAPPLAPADAKMEPTDLVGGP